MMEMELFLVIFVGLVVSLFALGCPLHLHLANWSDKSVCQKNSGLVGLYGQIISPLGWNCQLLTSYEFGSRRLSIFLTMHICSAWNFLFCPVKQTQTETESLLFLEG